MVPLRNRNRLGISRAETRNCKIEKNPKILVFRSFSKFDSRSKVKGFFSILQFLVSALEIPSRFRFRSGSLDFSSFGTMDLLVRRRPEEKFDFQNLTTIRNGLMLNLQNGFLPCS